MRRLTLAQIIFYFVGILAIFAGNIPNLLNIVGILALGLFINLIDLLNQVLVLGARKNQISEILRAQIPTQLEATI